MDKTDIKWYNTDMNDIIFVGSLSAKGDRDLHSHKGYEIIFSEDGGTIKVGSENFSFQHDRVVVIPPLTKHVHVTGKNYFSIVLERALLPIKATSQVQLKNYEHFLTAAKQANYYFGTDKSEGILSALGQLIAAYIASCSTWEYSPIVKTVMADIDKNVSRANYSLEDCISALPLNYDYVRKLFKKETGTTPHEYLLKSRMELAKSIMTSGMSNQYSRYTVSQIAEMCGFAEPLYFSRVFKKYYGYPPSQLLNEP
jgi:AraC-like DNA-binding protein